MSQGGSSRRREMLSALLCAVLLASCVAVPISGPLGPPLYGNKIDVPTAASAVAVGQSRDSVITAIGKSTVELTDLRILVYPWSEKTSEWLFISLLNNPQLQSGTTFTQADWAMLIALDDNDFVAHAGITKRSPTDSINTVARRWAEAQGLSVPPVKTSFALSPIPPDKSLLYVFRKTRTSPMGILGWSSWPRPVAVAVDAQYRSELRDEVYIALIVEPGMHEVLADALPPYRYVEYGTALRIAPERRRPASIKIEALPGSTYFIELVCTSGTGTIETSLRLIPDADALPIIRQLHAAW